MDASAPEPVRHLQTVQDILDTPLGESQSVMAIMIPYDDPQYTAGDYKVVWDRTKPDEVQAARDQFASWKKKGYMAYSVTGAKAEKGTVLREFDPEAQSIIFAPALQGGL